MYQDWGFSEDQQSVLFGIPMDPSDPFYDGEVDVLVGVSRVIPQGLAYCLDAEDPLDIVDKTGGLQGKLVVRGEPAAAFDASPPLPWLSLPPLAPSRAVIPAKTNACRLHPINPHTVPRQQPPPLMTATGED